MVGYVKHPLAPGAEYQGTAFSLGKSRRIAGYIARGDTYSPKRNSMPAERAHTIKPKLLKTQTTYSTSRASFLKGCKASPWFSLGKGPKGKPFLLASKERVFPSSSLLPSYFLLTIPFRRTLKAFSPVWILIVSSKGPTGRLSTLGLISSRMRSLGFSTLWITSK